MRMSHRPLTSILCGLVLALTASWVRHGHADAPSDRYMITAETVYDTKTQLTWQRINSASQYTWSDAQSYCSALQLAGKDDWRVPSMKELQTIVDEIRTDIAIDPTVFPGTPNDRFWTSSALAGNASSAWTVNFTRGDAYTTDVSYANWVRCLR